MYLLPKSMNGIVPDEPPYLVISACWAAVGVCSRVYDPVDGSGMLVVSSTDVNVRYWLVYVAWTNVQVGVSGSVSVVDECTVLSPVNVPNRFSATIIAQRSAPQYGQYSAPMNSISGLPFAVRAGPLIDLGIAVTAPPPSPTAASVLAGTVV